MNCMDVKTLLKCIEDSQRVHTGVECESCRSMKQRNQQKPLRNEKCVVIRKPALSENLNDPCRRSELNNMYEELQTQIWPQTKDRINKFEYSEIMKQLAKDLIKKTFEEGKKLFPVIKVEQINGMPNESKMLRYIQSSIENLRMVFFLFFENIKNTSDFEKFVEDKKPSLHEVFQKMKTLSLKEGSDQKYQSLQEGHDQKYQSLLEGRDQKYQSVPDVLHEVLHELYVHCYFVSRLMALHDPPIEVCWDRAGVNVFPDLCPIDV